MRRCCGIESQRQHGASFCVMLTAARVTDSQRCWHGDCELSAAGPTPPAHPAAETPEIPCQPQLETLQQLRLGLCASALTSAASKQPSWLPLTGRIVSIKNTARGNASYAAVTSCALSGSLCVLSALSACLLPSHLLEPRQLVQQQSRYTGRAVALHHVASGLHAAPHSLLAIRIHPAHQRSQMLRDTVHTKTAASAQKQLLLCLSTRAFCFLCQRYALTSTDGRAHWWPLNGPSRIVSKPAVSEKTQQFASAAAGWRRAVACGASLRRSDRRARAGMSCCGSCTRWARSTSWR
jgi:hypothetical protein